MGVSSFDCHMMAGAVLITRSNSHGNDLDEKELFALAAFGGSSLTRECSRLAFAKHGRSLQASDLTEQVPKAFENLFEGLGPKL